MWTLVSSAGMGKDIVLHKFPDGGPQILIACWSETALCSLSHVALHRAAHNMAADFIKSEQKRGKRDPSQHLFKPNLRSDIPLHLLDCLCSRSDSLHLRPLIAQNKYCKKSFYFIALLALHHQLTF